MEIEPDTKDWTWVLDRPCPECGLDARAVAVEDVPGAVLANAAAWQHVLRRPDVTARPTSSTWSPLEYACHVRDVHTVFDGRLRLLLESDDPLFANWDQDVAALEGRYGDQDATEVGSALAAAAGRVAERYGQVGDDEVDRPGRRSNGSLFTVTTLARYHLHDVVHHLWDVRG